MTEKKKNILTFLGSGTSTGIPIPGCSCGVCTSSNPKNKRLRSSLYVQEKSGINFIIDTGPDLRTQLLREKIDSIDFVIITHDHADHLHGIDDLRPLTFFPSKKTIPVFCHDIHLSSIKQRFNYIFDRESINKNQSYKGGGLPQLDLYPLEELNNKFKNLNIKWNLAPHGNGKTTIIHHSELTYLIDCHDITDPILNHLQKGANHLLVIDCVKYGRHPSHLGTDKTKEILLKTSPKRGFLTHLGHDLDHDKLESEFQQEVGDHVFLAYDGLKLRYD